MCGEMFARYVMVFPVVLRLTSAYVVPPARRVFVNAVTSLCRGASRTSTRSTSSAVRRAAESLRTRTRKVVGKLPADEALARSAL